MRLLVTGAAGFLGQRVVDRALERGHRVRAVVRPGSDLSAVSWFGMDGVEVVGIDMAAASAEAELVNALAGMGHGPVAVVHLAGALVGNDAVQRTDTVEPTGRLVQAMLRARIRRLVLVSSLSVYGYSALPEGAQLDETTPTETYTGDRDAYCRAKLAQEAIVMAAAQQSGLLVTCLRPGVIFGPGRLWTARLGQAAGPLLVLFGGNATLPVVSVRNCAEAIVLAAETEVFASDVFVAPDHRGGGGAFEAINVIDDELPTQKEYAGALVRHARGGPKILFRLPWGLLRRLAAALSLMTLLAPGAAARLPGVLRPAGMHARIKPLRYSNCRLRDRLGWRPALNWQSAVPESVATKTAHPRPAVP